MAEEKKEEKYSMDEHLRCLKDFYVEISIALALEKKKKERIGVMRRVLKTTNKELWPIIMLAVKEGRLKNDKQYKEIFDMLKIEKTRKHRKIK